MAIDRYKHKGKRRQLVNLLKSREIADQRVLDAMNKIPRHLFLSSAFEDYAYQDKAFSIGVGQTISHPFTVAFQSQLLEVLPEEKVLEIGTGSGYQTAVLVVMRAEVYTIERQKVLFDFSNHLLKKLNLSPKFQSFGDGYLGLPSFAPFDKILVTAGAKEIPKNLLKQLKIGGIMVVPIGENEQKMLRITRISESKFEQSEFGEYQFVPMLEDKEK